MSERTSYVLEIVKKRLKKKGCKEGAKIIAEIIVLDEGLSYMDYSDWEEYRSSDECEESIEELVKMITDAIQNGSLKKK